MLRINNCFVLSVYFAIEYKVKLLSQLLFLGATKITTDLKNLVKILFFEVENSFQKVFQFFFQFFAAVVKR